jgi:hypothetical protein
MSCGSGEPQLASSGRTTRRHSFSGPVASGEVIGAMATVNYWRSSFHPGGRSFSRGPVGYKRFKSAAEAIRFAMEELHRSCFLPTLRSKRTDSTAAPSGSFTRAKPIH